MYIIIAGGGKVGRYLTESLVNEGYEVLLIERVKAKVEQYTEQLGGVVVQGDACEALVLADAGVARADIVIAVTGDDEDNLVICQMAKRKFNVGRVIARINNPKNEPIFNRLGIDASVSPTEIILNMIAQQIPSFSFWHISALRDNKLVLIDTLLNSKSPAVNKSINSFKFPPDTSIVSVVRGGKVLPMQPDLILSARDELLIIVERQTEAEVRRLLVGAE